ncbi:hypothetical protein YC2023_072073 [Brassica napus]
MASHTHTQPELSNLIHRRCEAPRFESSQRESRRCCVELIAEVYGQGLAILVPRRLVQEKNTSGSKEDGVKSLAPSGDEERRGL